MWPSLGSTLLPAPPSPVQPSSLSGLGQPLHCLAEWPGPGHSTSLCLSFPPLSPLGPGRVGGMTRGQCRFQGEFSDLGIPHAPRGGETFFTQHCRGQTPVHPLLRSSARRGPEGVLCRCLGSWGWALHGGGWGSDQLGSCPAPLREKAVAPGPARVCTLHRNLCGCFSKKRDWRSPFVCLGMGIWIPKPRPGVCCGTARGNQDSLSVWPRLSWFPTPLETQWFARLPPAGRRNVYPAAASRPEETKK